MSILWHNDNWIDETAGIFTSHDRIRLGDGVFDTMLAVDGKLIHPEKHQQRLTSNAAILGIDFELDFENIALELLKRTKLTTGRTAINTVISRGPGQRGIMAPDNPDLQIVMRAGKTPDEFPPLHVIIAGTVHRNEGSPLSQIKSFNYGDNILALNEAKSREANEAILLNNAGHITCATSANLFALINGKLVTPPLRDGVLNGITRQMLMEQHEIEETSLTAEELLSAESVFLTNCIRGAQPIEKLENKNFSGTLPLGIDKDFYLK